MRHPQRINSILIKDVLLLHARQVHKRMGTPQVPLKHNLIPARYQLHPVRLPFVPQQITFGSADIRIAQSLPIRGLERAEPWRCSGQVTKRCLIEHMRRFS